MSDLQHTLTHVADGEARLIEAFKDKPLVTAVLRVSLLRVQHFEDVLWDIYTGVWLPNAIGVQLDNLGDIVGEPRKGRADDLYRLWVKARILANRSNGKQQELLAVLRLLIGPGPTVTYTRTPPAAFRIEIAGMSSSGDVARTVQSILTQMKAAGVRMELEYTDEIATAFTFAVDATEGTVDHVKGFGDTSDPSVGGFFSGVL